MARKRYQRGSLQLRGAARDRWVLVWREDVQDPQTGTVARIQRVTPVGTLDELPTKPLARRKADMLLAAAGVNELDYRPRASVTFAEAAEMWKAHRMVHLKEGTQLKAKQHLAAHLLPAFGGMPLDAIGTLEVQTFITKLSTRMKAKSVANVLGTLAGVCSSAKAWGLSGCRCRREDLVMPRDHQPRQVIAFTVPDVRGILTHAAQPYRAMFALAALAALRGGEVLGLHVADVDLVEEVLRIRWSVSPSRKLQSVKSTKAERTVPMAPPLAAVLQDYLSNHWTPNPDGLLFATRTGRPLSHTKVLERGLWPTLLTLGIPQRGMHAFRHTATSLLIEEGVPLPLVQAIVGHAHVSTTLGIYAHVIRSEHREAMQKLGNLFCDSVVTLQKGKALVQ